MVVDDFTDRVYGSVIASNVSEEEYLEKYAEHFCEWVDGTVIRIAPETLRHGTVIGYLLTLLKIYCELNPVATVVPWPFPMRLPPLKVCREPNLMVILKPRELADTDYAMNGAADICIEVISPESVLRDRGEKFEEYERGGVGEYWIFDYQRSEALYYRRNSDGIFARQTEDADDNYRSLLLPGLVINVPTLWREKLPDFNDIGKAVEAMLH